MVCCITQIGGFASSQGAHGRSEKRFLRDDGIALKSYRFRNRADVQNSAFLLDDIRGKGIQLGILPGVSRQACLEGELFKEGGNVPFIL